MTDVWTLEDCDFPAGWKTVRRNGEVVRHMPPAAAERYIIDPAYRDEIARQETKHWQRGRDAL